MSDNTNPFGHLTPENLIVTLDAVRSHVVLQEKLFGMVSNYLKDSLDALEQAAKAKNIITE